MSTGKREFTKLLNKITDKKTKLIDTLLINQLTYDEKSFMVNHIVRNRGPIIKQLIPSGFDLDWLACMGYLYETPDKNWLFIHTSEHRIK